MTTSFVAIFLVALYVTKELSIKALKSFDVEVQEYVRRLPEVLLVVALLIVPWIRDVYRGSLLAVGTIVVVSYIAPMVKTLFQNKADID